ncbi:MULTISPECIES: hypothetical protein [unclassified Picosynechococcus]|uniref:hypothetical protein n=1 Tax=unclassified Picosynechococcus TaxID=3079910 RepID=UPI0004A9DDC6|nr:MULTISPECIES: hypothetical protein [unclassified Picosynechococcus]
MWRRCLLALTGAWGMGLAIAPVMAQPLPKQAIFENLQLRPNFAPNPQLLRGVSGGSEPAAEFLGIEDTPTGSCVGFIDNHADHRLSLMTFFNDLKLSVESAGDTVLVVKGPGGVWCNDDAVGQNPAIRGEWQKGLYQVWVGSRGQRQYYPYILEIHHRK